MHVFKKLRVRQKADNPANYRYLKEIEKYKERLQLIAPPNLNFPENRPVHFKHSGNCGVSYIREAARESLGSGDGQYTTW